MKTFREFILSRRVTDTPRGDFIDDTQTLIRCQKFPDVKSWRQLEWFISSRQQIKSPEIVAEGHKLWREFAKTLSIEDILS
jgi:hypothetical protein